MSLNLVGTLIYRQQSGGADELYREGRERTQVSRAGAGFMRVVQHEIYGPLDPSVRVAGAAAALLDRLNP